MRIRSAHAVEFFHLARRKFLMRIKTPAAFQQTLTPQDLMYSWNTSTKLVSRIEDCRVRVVNLLGECELFAGDHVGIISCHLEMRNSGLCPHCPMPQQATDDPNPLVRESKRCKQVVQNVVVIAGV